MKKITLLILFLLMPIILFATKQDEIAFMQSKMQASLVPMFSSGINLRSNKLPSLKDAIDQGKEFEYNFSGTSSETKVMYKREQILLSGSFTFKVDPGTGWMGSDYYDDQVTSEEEALLYKIIKGGYVKCSVESTTGEMVMTSQSNSAYKRPIEIYGVLVTSRQPATGGLLVSDTYMGTKYFENIDSTITSEPLIFGVEGVEKDPVLKNGASIFFNILLGLPNDYKPDDPTKSILIYNNQEYRLAEADDYTAVLTVTATLYASAEYGGAELAKQSFTFPIAGYVSNDAEVGAPDKSHDAELSKAGLDITMLPGAYNIDLMRDYSKSFDIAEINMLATYGAKATVESDVDKDIPSEMGIFLSSHANPYVSGDTFKFKNTKSYGNYSETNSLGFKLYMNDKSGNRIMFDGTSYLNALGVQNGSITLDSSMIEKRENYHFNGNWNDYVGYTKSFGYDGKISIEIDKPPEYLLKGLYQETVYVHIVSKK